MVIMKEYLCGYYEVIHICWVIMKEYLLSYCEGTFVELLWRNICWVNMNGYLLSCHEPTFVELLWTTYSLFLMRNIEFIWQKTIWSVCSYWFNYVIISSYIAFVSNLPCKQRHSLISEKNPQTLDFSDITICRHFLIRNVDQSLGVLFWFNTKIKSTLNHTKNLEICGNVSNISKRNDKGNLLMK